MRPARVPILLGLLGVAIVLWWALTPHPPSPSPGVYEPQRMYVYVLLDPSRMDEYRVLVYWDSPDPTGTYPVQYDSLHGAALFYFDLPYAPDINQVTVLYPSGESAVLVFNPPRRVPGALVVIDVSPADTAYVLICSDARVFRGADGLWHYTGFCTRPFALLPGTYQEYNAYEVLPGVNP